MVEHRGAAVITGAGRGIGRAIALELASLGHPVALQSRTEAQLLDTRGEVEARGGRALVVAGDVSSPSAATELVERCRRELGPVTIAVACAGQAISQPLLKTTAEQMTHLFEVNVLSAFHLLQTAARTMIENEIAGRIIVVASTAAVRGMRYTAAYSASKHAVLGLVRTAALELAPKGITVNAVCPGWVKTPMFAATLENIAAKTGQTEAEAARRIEEMIPMGSVLETEEVAGLVRFLVSEAAAHVTGQAIVMDGGETLA